ncbi:MAG: SDR family oxidoreductase [Methylocystaceae bacterium]
MPLKSKIMVTGAGWLADELHNVLSDTFDVMIVPPKALDITSRLMCYQLIEHYRPQTIIHTAGDDNLDHCQSDPGWSYRSHVVGTRNIIKAATRVGAKIVYPSTVHVFAGDRDEAYTEEDLANPVNILGQTKFWAERLVINSRPDSLIIRSSWLYGRGNMGFFSGLEQMLNRDLPVKVVADQLISPTYSRDFCQALKELLLARACGVYHLTNRGSCTLYQMFRYYLALTGQGERPTYPISGSEVRLPAPRPQSGALASTQLDNVGISMRSWQEAMTVCLKKREHLANIITNNQESFAHQSL